MVAVDGSPDAPGAVGTRAPARGRRRDVALLVTAAASAQCGAAMGAHAFAQIGPAGVVGVRQIVAAAVLLPVARPDVRRLRRDQWWPVLLLAVVFGMTSTLPTINPTVATGG